MTVAARYGLMAHPLNPTCEMIRRGLSPDIRATRIYLGRPHFLHQTNAFRCLLASDSFEVQLFRQGGDKLWG